MNLRSIIEDIASQADDFLEGASNRAEARAGVSILEDEGFFDRAPGEIEDAEGGAGTSEEA
jgi:hypothetical protein